MSGHKHVYPSDMSRNLKTTKCQSNATCYVSGEAITVKRNFTYAINQGSISKVVMLVFKMTLLHPDLQIEPRFKL